MKLKPYPKYKESGVQWIGEIPEVWEVHKIKFKETVIMGQSPDSEDYNYENRGHPFLQGNAEFTELNPNPIIWCEMCNKFSQKNDILLSVRAPVGALNISDKKYGIGRGLCAIRCKLPNHKFIFYQLMTFEFYLNSISTGSTYTAISTDDVANLVVRYPSINEQSKISSFLDSKTSEIDKTIEKDKQLIELLKEKRIALINHVVTKGLNPKAKMKDSGIDWIGEIPENWEVKKLKFVSDINISNVDKKSEEGEIDVLLCNYVDVYKNEFITPKINFMKATASFEQIRRFNIKKYDVIITKDSEEPTDIAVPALITEDLNGVVCGYHLALIRPNKLILQGSYLLRALQSKKINDQFIIEANGVTRFGISTYPILNSYITLPPKSEQIKIAEFLDKSTLKIDQIVQKVEAKIELLEEFKKSLIHHVVTGKVDVRSVTA